MTPTPSDVLLAVLAWIGVSGLSWLAGAWLYGRAAYDAWGESNVDKRVLLGGILIGFGGCWFLRGPFFP